MKSPKPFLTTALALAMALCASAQLSAMERGKGQTGKVQTISNLKDMEREIKSLKESIQAFRREILPYGGKVERKINREDIAKIHIYNLSDAEGELRELEDRIKVMHKYIIDSSNYMYNMLLKKKLINQMDLPRGIYYHQ